MFSNFELSLTFIRTVAVIVLNGAFIMARLVLIRLQKLYFMPLLPHAVDLSLRWPLLPQLKNHKQTNIFIKLNKRFSQIVSHLLSSFIDYWKKKISMIYQTKAALIQTKIKNMNLNLLSHKLKSKKSSKPKQIFLIDNNKKFHL